MTDLRNRPGQSQYLYAYEHENGSNKLVNQQRMNGDGADRKQFIVNDLYYPRNSEMDDLKQNLDDNGEPVNDGASNKQIRIFGRHFNIIVLVIHFNIFLYSCSFWIQNAVFPYLSKELGADPVTFGYLQTVFALVQLAGGPLFGRFGDLFGSRNAMMLAFVAATLSYLFLFVSTSIPLLFLSRLPSVFMHAMQGGQMIVTDVCDTKERAAALSKLGLSYGVGMVVGPIAGGVISTKLGLQAGSLVACFLSILSLVLIYHFIPAKLKRTPAGEEEDKKVKSDASKESVFSLRKIGELLRAPGASFLMGIKLGTGIPIGIFQSMFSIMALVIFKLPPDQNSFMMSYIGILAMIVQGFVVGPVSKRYSELAVLTASAAILCFAYLLLSFVTSMFEMCFVFIPLVTGLTLQNVLTTSALTHTVSAADTGAMLGMSMAVNSLIRAVSPTLGGFMLSVIGFHSFGYLGFITSAIVTCILLVKMRRS